MQKIHIKNMVCDRCIMVVSDILNQHKIPFSNVSLGNVDIEKPLTNPELNKLKKDLNSVGFEIIDDSKQQTIEAIKRTIIELVRHHLNEVQVNYSVYLEDKIGKEYNYLSHLFSSTQGQTIEKYIIAQKVERAKELLVYEQQTLSEIAFELGYSSVAHLSAQFKKATGLSPSHFKSIGTNRRKKLDEI